MSLWIRAQFEVIRNKIFKHTINPKYEKKLKGQSKNVFWLIVMWNKETGHERFESQDEYNDPFIPMYIFEASVV